MLWLDPPRSDCVADSAEQLAAQAGQQFGRRCRQVIAVEGEEERPPGLLSLDQPLDHEPVERGEDPAMGGAAEKASDLASGQRPTRPGKNRQHPRIEGWADDGIWTRQIHMDILPPIWMPNHPYGGLIRQPQERNRGTFYGRSDAT